MSVSGLGLGLGLPAGAGRGGALVADDAELLLLGHATHLVRVRVRVRVRVSVRVMRLTWLGSG